MTNSDVIKFNPDALIPKYAWCTPTHIEVSLESGVMISAPLSWYPSIKALSHADRNQIMCAGLSLFFEKADELVSIEGLLLGWKEKGVTAPVMDAAE